MCVKEKKEVLDTEKRGGATLVHLVAGFCTEGSCPKKKWHWHQYKETEPRDKEKNNSSQCMLPDRSERNTTIRTRQLLWHLHQEMFEVSHNTEKERGRERERERKKERKKERSL
jgi:hypothetical protein